MDNARRKALNLIFCCGLMTALTGLLWSPVSHAGYDPSYNSNMINNLPKKLKGIGVTEHKGAQIDPNLTFTDDNGKTVKLGDFFDGTHPVLLTLVYYTCRNLCNYHLNGLVQAFKKMSWQAGKQFKVVAVSINPRETAHDAAEKKNVYLKELGAKADPAGWHFLTGKEDQIKKLAAAVGFTYRWDEKENQYLHTSVAYVVTPTGTVSQYLYGLEFDPETVRLSMVEASQGKLGGMVDQLILFCCQFNPNKNRYTLVAWNLMKVAGYATAAAVGGFLFLMWKKEKKRSATT